MSDVADIDVRGSKYEPESMSNGVSEEILVGLLLVTPWEPMPGSGSCSSSRTNSSSQSDLVEGSPRGAVGWSAVFGDTLNTALLKKVITLIAQLVPFKSNER